MSKILATEIQNSLSASLPATDEFKLPLLTLVETASSLSLVLVLEETANVVQTANVSLIKTLAKLIKKFELNNLDQILSEGDNSVYALAVNDDQVDFEFKHLLEELSKIYDENLTDPKLDPAVQTELNKYLKLDLGITYIEALYRSLMLVLINQADEFGIRSFGFIGDTLTTDKFKLIASEASTEISLYFSA